MSDLALPLLLCGSIIVMAGIAGMVYLFVTSRKPKKEIVTEESRPKHMRFDVWIVSIILAIALGFLNISLAIFPLIITWVLRLNPNRELSHVVSDNERKICEKNYKWLKNSSFFTIPVFLIALFLDAHPFIAVFLPFIFHIPLMNRLLTEKLFIYRHTQQALLLLLLRAGTAIAIFSIFYSESFLFFIIVNGSLWLFGTNWEIKQVKNNDCWLMRRRGEEIIVLRVPIGDQPSVELNQTVKDELNRITAKEMKTEIKKSLTDFRKGTREERSKAVLILAELGEVEKF